MIFDRGRAFEFLAWYRPLVLDTPVAAKPDLTTLGLAKQWSLRKPGTCSAQHLKGMELENIGQLAVDRTQLERAFPFMPAGIYQAVNDISIANELSISKGAALGRQTRPTISTLAEISRVDH